MNKKSNAKNNISEKEEILLSLTQSVIEINLINKGKLKGRPAKKFLTKL